MVQKINNMEPVNENVLCIIRRFDSNYDKEIKNFSCTHFYLCRRQNNFISYNEASSYFETFSASATSTINN
jgi:hypothetical protein